MLSYTVSWHLPDGQFVYGALGETVRVGREDRLVYVGDVEAIPEGGPSSYPVEDGCGLPWLRIEPDFFERCAQDLGCEPRIISPLYGQGLYGIVDHVGSAAGALTTCRTEEGTSARCHHVFERHQIASPESPTPRKIRRGLPFLGAPVSILRASLVITWAFL